MDYLLSTSYEIFASLGAAFFYAIFATALPEEDADAASFSARRAARFVNPS